MKTKTLSLLLAVIMLSAALASCSGTSDAERESASSGAVSTDPEILEIDGYVDGLAAQSNFNGATFTYVGEGGENAEHEEETGNIENDALYQRQRELEEKFGITWQSKKVNGYSDEGTVNVAAFVKEAVMSGLKDYDLVYGNPITVGAVLFVENCLVDVSEFGTIDLDNEWWNPSLRDKYSFAGKLYFLTGSIVTSYFNDPSCLLFNKEVAEDFNIKEPYDLVKSGEWTFDRMFEVASAIPINTNGNGVYRYGKPNGLAILFANGASITYFDDDGIPYIPTSLPVELSDIADKFSAVMGDNSQCAHEKNLNNMGGTQESFPEKYGYKSEAEMFVDQRILFLFATTGYASRLREKETEFGILPVPMKDTSQGRYYSYGDNWNSCFVYVPRCARDIEMTDVITEAMAALGHKYIKPAYYDKILKGRSTYDAASREMIDIVFESKVYDMADMYGDGNINTPGLFISSIKYAIDDDSSSFATDYFVYGRTANIQIKNLLKQIESFE